eukprot:3211416-Pyramimonas_sp.AAC.1
MGVDGALDPCACVAAGIERTINAHHDFQLIMSKFCFVERIDTCGCPRGDERVRHQPAQHSSCVHNLQDAQETR